VAALGHDGATQRRIDFSVNRDGPRFLKAESAMELAGTSGSHIQTGVPAAECPDGILRLVDDVPGYRSAPVESVWHAAVSRDGIRGLVDAVRDGRAAPPIPVRSAAVSNDGMRRLVDDDREDRFAPATLLWTTTEPRRAMRRVRRIDGVSAGRGLKRRRNRSGNGASMIEPMHEPTGERNARARFAYDQSTSGSATLSPARTRADLRWGIRNRLELPGGCRIGAGRNGDGYG
jgi:hypothetical protein